MTPSVDAEPSPPVLAIYATSLAPYELHLYRRFASELPIRLQVLVARRDSSRDWRFEDVEGLTLEDLSGGDRDTKMTDPRAQLREWRRGRRAIERLQASGAAAVVIAGYNDLGRLRIARWCRSRGKPVFIRSDSNLADEAGKPALKIAVKRAFLRVVRGLTTFTFASGPRGEAYWKHYGQPADRIVTVPLEPDYSLVESITPEEAAEAAARYGLDPDRRRLVYSGRLSGVKRVDLLIDAFGQIANERPQWDVLVLGDGDLRGELEARVPESLRERVTWAGFVAEQRDVCRLYHASDVLVLPSDYEPWALVVNEAAAAGLAIVTSDIVGANPALVHPGVNGESFPHGDSAALAEALRRVTAPEAIDRYKEASPGALAAWRNGHDPVEGLREALVRSGVLPDNTEGTDL